MIIALAPGGNLTNSEFTTMYNASRVACKLERFFKVLENIFVSM
jgi:hypothetical protein